MTPTSHSRVSASALASIWDFPEHGSRGPRARHDRAAIAALAVRIADAEGLDAVTMRRLAGEVGIAVMSLYNYVPAKEHLAQLMTDQLAGEYDYPVTPAPDPRAAIADLARQARDIARRHPWLAGLLHPPMPPGPNGLRYLDYFLGLLAGSRLDTGARLEIITMISAFATMYGAMQAAPASQPAGPSEQATAQVQSLTRAVAQGRYPHLAAALATVGPPRRHDDIFRSCIERLIDTARLRLRQCQWGRRIGKQSISTVILGFRCHGCGIDGQDPRSTALRMESRTVAASHPLDNPVRSSLAGPHARFAQRCGSALRYSPDVCPFLAMPDEPDAGDWADAAGLVGPGGLLPLAAVQVAPPAGWDVRMRGDGVQLTGEGVTGLADPEAVPLGSADVPEMLDLTRRTKPGPFLPRTVEMGTYLGIRCDGALVAMAGERLHPSGWSEISAVCTDEAWRGHGLATRLVLALVAGIRARGEIPFLHALASNVNAIGLYEELGFRLRQRTVFSVIRVPEAQHAS